MTRPRIAAIISAIVSSTTGFLVMTRWGLAGTLAGAAIIPVIYTLVAHWSEQTVERLSHWGRRRVLGQGIEPAGEASAQPAEPAGPAEGEQSPAKPKIRAATWAVGLAAAAALALSIYTLTLPEEPVEVRQMIVEKTVVVTVPEEETGSEQDKTQTTQSSQAGRSDDAGQAAETPSSTPSTTPTTAAAGAAAGAGQDSASDDATSTTVTSVPEKTAPSSPSTSVPATKMTTPTTVPGQ